MILEGFIYNHGIPFAKCPVSHDIRFIKFRSVMGLCSYKIRICHGILFIKCRFVIRLNFTSCH